MKDKKLLIKTKLKKIATGISWAIFGFLILCAVILVYYFVATKIYQKKGAGYEPAFTLYTIISPSMVPNINVYDVVVNTKVSKPTDIKVGDIITFNSTDFTVGKAITVTHRVTEVLVDSKGNYSYTTKGDNNAMKDPNPTLYSNVIGKVAFKLPQLGRVQFFVASKSGWLLIVVIPALYIIIKDVLKLVKIIEPDSGKKSKKQKKNILFIPIKKKPLYLPFHGYKDENGEKQKFTLNSLVPFTFDRHIDNYEEKEIKKDDKSNLTSLEDIYKDLKDLADDKKNK